MTDRNSAQARRPDTSGLRLLILAGFFVVLSGLGFWAVYSQFAGENLTFDDRLLNASTLASVCALLCIYFAADGLRLYYTLRALGQAVALSTIFRLVFINIFFSNITPMATGGGFAQIWFLQRHGVRIGTATAATTIRTVLAMIFIFTLTPFFLLTLEELDNQALIGEISGLLAVLIILYLGFFGVVLLRTRWLIAPLSVLLQAARKAHLISSSRHKRWQFKARREMVRFARSFSLYAHGPRGDVLLSVFFTAVFLLSLFSFPALLIHSLGYDTDYLISLGLLVVTTFVMYFAPTPGASGISEGVFGSFFSGILSPAHLVVVTIVWRVLTIYLGMLVGLVVTQLELSRGRSAK
ncbi:MAG TPA: flippase-like domain-containing protein [Pseudomonas xinjiangensis]|uniref:Flippase-like domain-containing protein n=2 Tax=root TaxID=1 RepID=A0A7V1BR82_9GAMM|nr:flippase-like domain-containing protein [Halopseudomonas xinjiangensis]HEC46278.1 flippase-like domain-containing protein [Halopseudomonas xinjiangensis]